MPIHERKSADLCKRSRAWDSTEATERLFEKFYRGDGRKTGGLGLGLSIARGLIEAHGGRLTGGEPGWRRRALRYQAASSRDEHERDRNNLMKSARSALIIDDEKQIRRLLRIALEGADQKSTKPKLDKPGLLKSSTGAPILFCSTLVCRTWKAQSAAPFARVVRRAGADSLRPRRRG